ncbi:MAG TPA: tetratricopeptide repeat protein [Bacteroidia bacterium]|jgi:tetratricopeptide (TPR) repeat protein|nr:tetratricopeptide repeat protein [Bacteroidia bacterium]
MKPVTKKQIAVLAGSSIIVVLLLFANTKLPKNKEVANHSEHAGPSSETNVVALITQSFESLTASQKLDVQKLEKAVEVAVDKKTAFEQLINMCDSLRQPVAAAYYMEKAAIASPVEKNWSEAGTRYYMAVRFTKPEQHPMLYAKAMECFEKVLALNPDNLETKISLGSCYVEGSSEPMKGIAMLREVEKIDSNNVNLQMSFAFFSEKSGQWDKAIKRFEKVLEIKPDLIDVHLHLADAYRQMGDTKNAIKSLEKYMTLVDDVVIKAEIQNYINQLKNS